jgi:hypothetical protein
MVDYITRKKTLRGMQYEVEVALPQYGGDIVRVHAIPDMALARIEERVGYTLEEAIGALASQNLTEEEITALKANAADTATIMKATNAISPKLTLFLGELAKAAIIPDPACTCKGKGCDDCDVGLLVEEFRGFTVMAVGMAVIGASTSSWADVENFSSRPRAQSGPA